MTHGCLNNFEEGLSLAMMRFDLLIKWAIASNIRNHRPDLWVLCLKYLISFPVSIMFKSALLTAVLVAVAATTAHALPVCYMDMHGVRTDLSHMCGGSERQVSTTAVSRTSIPVGADVWTRNLFFSPSGSVITGNIHNSGSVAAERVLIEATGYAEGRTPQVRTTSIERLAANGASAVAIDFGFGVPVDSWDVRVVEWDEAGD